MLRIYISGSYTNISEFSVILIPTLGITRQNGTFNIVIAWLMLSIVLSFSGKNNV